MKKIREKLARNFVINKKNLFKSPKIININKDKKIKEEKTKPIANLG
jgi:hypothetical protein